MLLGINRGAIKPDRSSSTKNLRLERAELLKNEMEVSGENGTSDARNMHKRGKHLMLFSGQINRLQE